MRYLPQIGVEPTADVMIRSIQRPSQLKRHDLSIVTFSTLRTMKVPLTCAPKSGSDSDILEKARALLVPPMRGSLSASTAGSQSA